MRIFVLLSVIVLAGPALADEAVPAVFRDLERTVDFDDAASVAGAKARLDAVRPDWWETGLPPGDLRGALAASLTRDEVLALLRRAARDPGERSEREAALAENLASRPDATALLLREEVFQRLVRSHRRLATDLAEVAIVEGDLRPALVLLGDPATAAIAADGFARMAWPDGLRFLADVLTGVHALPPEALARLGAVEPDVANVHGERPLGPARVTALHEVARASPDPALRALAARVLLRSATASAFEATVEAYRQAHTVFLEDDEWWRLARVHARLITSPRVSRRGRILALRGTMQFVGLDPSEYPDDAESAARMLRAWFATIDDPLLRGLVLRELESLHYYFVDADGRRKLPVPSYVALLGDLHEGRAEDPPALRDLARRVGLRLRSNLGREPGPHWRRKRPPPRRHPVLPEALRALDARGVAGLLADLEATPALRAQLADHADGVFETDAGGRFGRAAEEGLDLDPAVVAGLGRVLAEEADPHLVVLAGSILRLSPSPGAYETLLAHCARSWDASVDRLPVPDLDRQLDSLARLDVTLAFLADAEEPPWIREDVAERLFEFAWLANLAPEPRSDGIERIEAWIRERAPTLDAGLPEVVLPLWADADATLEGYGHDPPAPERIATTLRAAVESIPATGPRLRLRARLLESE